LIVKAAPEGRVKVWPDVTVLVPILVTDKASPARSKSPSNSPSPSTPGPLARVWPCPVLKDCGIATGVLELAAFKAAAVARPGSIKLPVEAPVSSTIAEPALTETLSVAVTWLAAKLSVPVLIAPLSGTTV